jgi:hypothetical protein
MGEDSIARAVKAVEGCDGWKGCTMGVGIEVPWRPSRQRGEDPQEQEKFR